MKISKQDSKIFPLFDYYVQGDPRKEQYRHFFCGAPRVFRINEF